MAANPWWEGRGLDGLNRGERQFVNELRMTRGSMVAGGDEIERQLQSFEDHMRDELRAQTRALVEAQVASANAIIQTLDAGFELVARILIAGFHSLEWRLDTLIGYAQRITFALEHPRQTQARELVRNGLYAFNQGWWEDARRDLTEARDVHRYDPVPWLYGGKIVFWVDGDASAADTLFAEAVRYGGPVNGRVAAEAFLERAHIRVLSHKAGEAADFADEAVSLDGGNIKVLMAAAWFHVLAGRKERAVELVTRAINLWPRLVKVVVRKWIAPIRSGVEEWIQRTHARELATVQPFYDRSAEFRDYLLETGIMAPTDDEPSWSGIENDIKQMSSGFLDLRLIKDDAEMRRNKICEIWKDIIIDIKSRLKNKNPKFWLYPLLFVAWIYVMVVYGLIMYGFPVDLSFWDYMGGVFWLALSIWLLWGYHEAREAKARYRKFHSLVDVALKRLSSLQDLA